MKKIIATLLALTMTLGVNESVYALDTNARNSHDDSEISEFARPSQKRNIKVIYQTYDGEEVDQETIQVSKKTKKITESQLNVPKGYEVTYISSIKNETVKVYVKSLYKDLTVVYMDGKTQVGQEVIQVPRDQDSVDEKDLHLPEYYEFVKVKSIRNNVVTVNVKLASLQVTVFYKDGNKTVGQEVISVKANKDTIDQQDLNIPQYYDFVSSTKVGSDNTVTVEVKRQTKTVNLIMELGPNNPIYTQTVTVDIEETEIDESLVQLSDGYRIVSISPIDSHNNATVIFEAIPTTKDIKVVYMNGDYKVSEEVLTIAIDAETVNESQLTIPENYKCVAISRIGTDGVVRVDVQKLLKSVRIVYKTTSGVVKGTQVVIVEKNATMIDNSMLTQVPQGYEVTNVSEIDGHSVTVLIENLSVAQEVKVQYLYNNNVIGEQTTYVHKNTNVIDPSVLSLPDGYKIVRCHAIDSNGIAKVELARKTKSVRVSYQTETGFVVTTQRMNVDIDALEIQESALTRIPEGYKVVSISAIEARHVKVIVEAIPTTQKVKVNYVYNDHNVGDEIVTVSKDAKTVKENQLNIPRGYKFVSASLINSQNTVKVELERKTKSVRVNYQTETGFVVVTQRMNVDIDALEIQESALTRLPEGYEVVSISGIQKNAVTVVVREIPTTQKVKVNYVYNNQNVGDEIVTVTKDARTVDESQLTIPRGYKFVSASLINSQNTVKVELERKTKSVRVNYQTSTGFVVSTQRVNVDIDALEIQESALTRLPEGYEVVSISGIQKNAVTVVVREIPTTKKVKVVYMNGDYKVDEEVITVAKDANTVQESDLTIPENYKFASVSNINSQGVVRVDVQKLLKLVHVSYQTSTGMIKGTQRVIVEKTALEIQEMKLTQVPEGYEVISISPIENGKVKVIVQKIPTTKKVKVNYVYNNENIGDEIVSVDKDARIVDSSVLNIPEDYKYVSSTTITSKNTVKVELARKTKSVRVNYETSTGVEKGTQRVNVDIRALEIQESALTRVPEGYQVVSISGIQGHSVTVIVEDIPITKAIKVAYVYNDEKIDEEIINVSIDATRIEKEDLQNIPHGYKYVKSTSINSQNVVKVELARRTKSVRINYETSTSIGKGTQRINVDFDALEIQESALTQIPEGYQVVSISGIQGHSVTVVVEDIPTTKAVKVVYMYEDAKVSEEVINVNIDATHIEKEDLQNIPYGYKYVKSTSINSQNIVKVELARRTKSVRINYETSTGIGKGTQRVNVDFEALEIQESVLTQIPEGYRVVSISGIQDHSVTVIVEEMPTTKDIKVVYMDGDAKIGEEMMSVNIDATRIEKEDLQNIPNGYKYVSSTNISSQNIVRVDLTRKTKSVVISYETSTGVVKGTQRVSVDIDALSVKESAFTRVPEGYKIVDVSLIQGHKLTVVVEEIPTTKDIKIVYVDGNEKIGEEVVIVDVDAQHVDASDLTIPEGYELIDITNINSQGVAKADVKKIFTPGQDVDSEKPQPEEKPEITQPTDQTEQSSQPQTGDTTALLPWAMMMMVAGGIFTIFKRKED